MYLVRRTNMYGVELGIGNETVERDLQLDDHS